MSKDFDPSDATSASQLHRVLAGTPRFVPNDTTIRLEHITRYNTIDSLFGERYYKVLFLTGAEEIGHWVLLTHIQDDPIEGHTIEYFDSFARPVPDLISTWAKSVGVTTILYSKTMLQDPESFHCGRFVLARISSQPTSLEMFTNLLTSSTFSPDQLVGGLFNVDNE